MWARSDLTHMWVRPDRCHLTRMGGQVAEVGQLAGRAPGRGGAGDSPSHRHASSA